MKYAFDIIGNISLVKFSVKTKAKDNLKVSAGGNNPRPFQLVVKVEKVHLVIG